MVYAFGNQFVCSDAKTAQAICFDKAIRTKTVTLEGDSYDPAGTLTGGSKNNVGVLLTKIADLAEATELLGQKKAELQAIGANLHAMEKGLTKAKEVGRIFFLADDVEFVFVDGVRQIATFPVIYMCSLRIFPVALRSFAISFQAVRNCSAITQQLLYNHSAIALQSPSDRSLIDLRSLCNHSAIVIQSLCRRLCRDRITLVLLLYTCFILHCALPLQNNAINLFTNFKIQNSKFKIRRRQTSTETSTR
jgi:stage V sporulation protein SpoVS